MKSFLALACIPALLVATAAPALAQTDIAGTWLAVYDGGVHSAIAQLDEGGAAVQEPDLSPINGNLLLGRWSVKETGAYSVSLRGWTYDQTGAVNGYYTKTEVERLHPGGKVYDGHFEVTFFDLGGTVTFEHGGTVVAHRLS